MGETEDNKREPRKPSAIQWIISGTAAIAVVAIFGFFVYEALTNIGGKPAIVLTPAEGEMRENAFYVEVTVENTGRKAAADVDIEGSFGSGEAMETATVTLDYAPSRSSETVTLVFAQEVPAGDLELKVLGFREP